MTMMMDDDEKINDSAQQDLEEEINKFDSPDMKEDDIVTEMKSNPQDNNTVYEQYNILHPDDPLMQRFQDALKAHLIRVDNKLSEEIYEINQALKSVQKEREEGGDRLRNLELNILSQKKVIAIYQNLCSDVIASREYQQEELEKTKKEHKKKEIDWKEAETNYINLLKQTEQLTLKEKWYSNLENEITSEISISQTVSRKDAQMQRELLRKKKQKDYILYKLDTEIWKIESEIKHLENQLELKKEDKQDIGQAISDVNTELEILQKELKNSVKNWNLILIIIKQKDEMIIEQNKQNWEMKSSVQALELEVDKIKKETANEMETNSHLTDMKMMTEKELESLQDKINLQKEKNELLENELQMFTETKEKCENKLKEISNKLKIIQDNEKELETELKSAVKSKATLEDQILEKLNETMLHDKAIRCLNKQLQDVKQRNKECDRVMSQVECLCNKNLLTSQKLACDIEDEELNLKELVNINNNKEKKLEKTKADVNKLQTSINVKETKILNLKKKIEEILHSTKGQEVNILELKLSALQRNIEEIDLKNQQSQEFWLRHQNNLVTLREQRNVQMHELNLLTKQTMIIEQKNYKVEYELEKQKNEHKNIERKINEMQQSLVQKNARLAAQKDFKQQLEDINYVTRNEYEISLEEAEKELMLIQIEIKVLIGKTENLKSILYNVQLECLSWEKKVQMACETNRIFKEERKGGGDIATMKSEIHKMEMRLSHLKKFQKKLIQDMEFCVSRRENILERVAAEEKRNPKTEHNRRIIIQKRLDDQRLKIKQLNKEVKQIEDEIVQLEDNQKEMLEKIETAQQALRENETTLQNMDKQIMEAETIKNHNFEIIVRKQRKASMLQKIKNKSYKMSCKNEAALDEEIKKQKTINENLKDILNQTKNDFPLLKNEIYKILMSLDVQ